MITAADPEFTCSHTVAGWVFYFLVDPDRACEHFDASLRLLPTNWWSHEGLGLMFARAGNQSKARHHLEEALRLNPTLWRGQRALAKLNNCDESG